MINKLKVFLVFIIGFLFGLIMHGITEVFAVWILLNWLSDFFYKISWGTWYIIHIVSMLLVEVLALIFVAWLYQKYER